MVKIPYIKIPSVRVGSIVPTSNIGTGGATPAPPTPITYLTQWKIVGNSEVHTDEYLTQWKVEGNSVVDNNTILSCGDLGQDGKYHVKISNGVTIYDIPLTEPLRKVNDVADSIEFVNGVATLTRKICKSLMTNLNWRPVYVSSKNIYRYSCNNLSTIIKKYTSSTVGNILCPIYDTCATMYLFNADREGIGGGIDGVVYIYDSNYNQEGDLAAFIAHIQDVELIYELETPTTETIQVSPFPISPTDTYTSANDTPYSAFEYKKNVEIWSCGEYSEVDNKWHIRILPEGYGIVDIALDEPLRMTNNVGDTIEFADGVATVTRNLKEVDLGTLNWRSYSNNRFQTKFELPLKPTPYEVYQILNTGGYTSVAASSVNVSTTQDKLIAYVTLFIAETGNGLVIRDESFSDAQDAKKKLSGIYAIYELATPTMETIQVPQIQEAESYTCVISQGAKAVEWSSFITNSE